MFQTRSRSRNAPAHVAVSAVAALVALLASPARAQITVTSYGAAFNSTTPAPGWAYQYNPTNPITAPANFVNLVGSGGGAGAGVYTVDGNLSLPRASPGAFVSFTASGGHPGHGTAQTGTFDVFAIARFTVPVADTYAITNSTVNRANGNFSGGNAVRVFVNGNAALISTVFTGPTSFNVNLGALSAGDNIYVAFGPDTNHVFDTFDTMNYTITRAGSAAAPEPGSVALLLTGVLALGGAAARSRKAA